MDKPSETAGRDDDHRHFPTGSSVEVVSGQYAGDRGTVLDMEPGLRPRSVWVALDAAGTHLIPGVRLTRFPPPAPAAGNS
ncbi:hypothetical protein [Amycolatopsis sp. FDAARGOS 1241]|uniref:hypothetical protein n=1 Tax=Amycolatopsis sp. FDAARGOS 1241 TaxID=2778070 RepID=UPI00194FA6E3|nr:hypothetical protein [Amycolatopsis sp. FDAARGOS 1241]QRP50352.1 hypothetical protein I6J71_23285 [Amycolatopsis sp. FDAARGOS 1241]